MVRTTMLGLAASLVLCAGSTSALAQGTAITYQGQLKNSGAAVNTATDMQFSLWTLATGGSQVGSTVTSLAVPVSEGLFTAPMDFGINPYTSSQNLYLQVAVRNPAGSGSYVPMGTRQLLTPAPFSLATRGINVDAAGNAVTIGNGAGATFLNLNDIANAKWRLSTNAFQLNFLNDDGGTFNSKMTITNTGNVGIGMTTAPGAKLQIDRGPDGGKALLLTNPVASWASVAAFNDYRYIQTASPLSTDGNWRQFNVAPGGVSIGYPNTPAYNSTDAMYINGNVGIGTNTPQSALQVRGGIQTVNPTAGIHMGLDGGATGAAILSIVGTNGFASLEFHGDSTQNDFGARILYNQADGSLTSQGASKFSVNVLEIRGGSDLVEGFDSQTAELEPGTLMVIDPAHPGQLMPSASAYDSKVAGIVSGANGVNPGIKMGQDGVMDGKNPIAMTGRVYVKATTANGAIKPGDLLTTSDLSGHAMKASDAGKSQGTVVGKAMSALDKDTGLVLVLVNLQ